MTFSACRAVQTLSIAPLRFISCQKKKRELIHHLSSPQ